MIIEPTPTKRAGPKCHRGNGSNLNLTSRAGRLRPMPERIDRESCGEFPPGDSTIQRVHRSISSRVILIWIRSILIDSADSQDSRRCKFEQVWSLNLPGKLSEHLHRNLPGAVKLETAIEARSIFLASALGKADGWMPARSPARRF